MDDGFAIGWHSGASDGDIGNMYGYTTHNRTLRRHVEAIASVRDEAEDVLHITPPEGFKPVPGRVNWLFTMFEGVDVPEIYKIYIMMADYLFVPCQWCKDLFSPFFPAEKIFVVPHGVSPEFVYRKRVHPFPRRKKFRFLWVGAHNPRKGYEELIVSWARAGFQINSQAELYVKTTNLDRVEKLDNVIIDGRNLPRRKLVELYHKAHCFVFPTRGEGFGLTLAEAMRTGLPSISPHYSGVTEFFDEEVGYPVGYDLKSSELYFISRPDLGKQDTRVCFPKMTEFVEKMVYVVDHYDEALKKGRKAYERLRDRFVWERSAQLLVDAMRSEYEKRKVQREALAESADQSESDRRRLWVQDSWAGNVEASEEGQRLEADEGSRGLGDHLSGGDLRAAGGET